MLIFFIGRLEEHHKDCIKLWEPFQFYFDKTSGDMTPNLWSKVFWPDFYLKYMYDKHVKSHFKSLVFG